MLKSPGQRHGCVTALFFLGLFMIVPIVAQPQPAALDSSMTKEIRTKSQIMDIVREMQKSNQMSNIEVIRKQLERASCQLSLPPVVSKKLTGQEIRECAQQAHLRVGWVYRCIKCDEWHVSLSGGYALTTNGAVATCYHVVNSPRDLHAGAVIAVDSEGRVFPIAEVLAANRYADACIVQVKGKGFTPLPLNTNVFVGNAVYFLNKTEDSGDFTSGVVKHLLQLPERPLENVRGAPLYIPLRIQVGVTFGPGSSGSPVLDECGNAIGHASSVTLVNDSTIDSRATPPSPSILHEATSARDILSLVRGTK